MVSNLFFIDPVDISKYIISKFGDKGCELPNNMKVNLMLFFIAKRYGERYGDYPFSELFEAWRWGPVLPSVYIHYRRYIDRPIVVSDENSSISENLPDDFLKVCDEVIEERMYSKPWDLSDESKKSTIWTDWRVPGVCATIPAFAFTD